MGNSPVFLRQTFVLYGNTNFFLNVIAGYVLVQVELVEEGPPRKLKVEYKNLATNEVSSEEFNTVLIAVGRDPCTSGIGLDKAGVIVDKKFVTCKLYSVLTATMKYNYHDVMCSEMM